MMLPRRRHDFDFFDDMLKDPFFTDFRDNNLMKTDVKEKKDKYLIVIDLPGYNKEDIKIQIENGYLIIHASTNQNKEEKDEGKYVCKERYEGECSRSFYIGEDILEEDIKAKFKNGTLTLEVPKKDNKKALPDEKRYIEIDDE